MKTPEEVSFGPDTSSTRTFQGTFSAQEEAPPTTFTLMLSGQLPTSLFPQMASSPISTPATDPSTLTSSTNTNIVCQVYTASLLAAYINNILSQVLARIQKMWVVNVISTKTRQRLGRRWAWAPRADNLSTSLILSIFETDTDSVSSPILYLFLQDQSSGRSSCFL